MATLADLLLNALDAFDGSEEERLQAIGHLRAATWIAVISVITDIEGVEQARQSLEALAQADTLLVVLALGWVPNIRDSGEPAHLTPRARALHARLERLLERRLEQDGRDPSQTVRGVEQAYRTILSRTLGQAHASTLRNFLAIHYAFRGTILRTAIALIGEGLEPSRAPSDPCPVPRSPSMPFMARTTEGAPSSAAPSASAPTPSAEEDPPSRG